MTFKFSLKDSKIYREWPSEAVRAFQRPQKKIPAEEKSGGGVPGRANSRRPGGSGGEGRLQ